MVSLAVMAAGWSLLFPLGIYLAGSFAAVRKEAN